jgi:glycine/D-amino acid oxidase-like deaminating enzyme
MPDRAAGYDVGVIGAGAVGCAIAYALARRKMLPALFGQGGVGIGSGAASAMIRACTDAAAEHALLYRRGAEGFSRLQEEIGSIEYLQTGHLTPALTDEAAVECARIAGRRAETGIDVRWLTREEVLSLEPALSPEVRGALYAAGDGCVNPFLLIRRLLVAIRRLGGAVLLHCGSVAVRPRGDGFLIETARDEVPVQRLVLAAGLGTAEVARQLGLNVPLRPARRSLLVTEASPPLLRHAVATVRQQITGEVLVESPREDAAWEPSTVLDRIRQIAGEAIKLIPALETARVVTTFTCLRTVAPDGRAVLGRLDGEVYVAAALGGPTLCPLLGDALAEMMSGRVPEGLDAWSPRRFGALIGP